MIGPWRILDVAPGTRSAALTTGGGDGWIPTKAPGDVYRALILAGRLADPFVGRNEAAAAWVRDREWWWHAPLYLTEVSDGETVELTFKGLDTFADVYLDGEVIGRADNMFRSWRFDLSALPAGRHDVAVCFHPPSTRTGDRPLPFWSSFSDRVSASRRTAMRKAQFGWGWDWGPDLPTVGIWRPVHIHRRSGATIRSINFSTLSIEDGRAQVRVDLDLSEPATAMVELFAPNDGPLVARTSVEPGDGAMMTVDDPQLWWCAGMGAQPLYTLVVVADGGAQARYQVGIRTLRLDQSPDPDDAGATFFRFILNEAPVFAKGANWVPADSCLGTVPDDTYTKLLERSVAANMNMIRVWAGGVYEPDVFYAECDRLGLLVWQDFMFACAPYPEHDAAFVKTVCCEIEEQVSRLRHHASLALWCGNNENQAIHWFDDVAKGTTTPLEGALFYDELIPSIVNRLDPTAIYHAGSPLGGPTPNSMRGGDVHDWTVWHGVPPVFDADPVGAFETAPERVAATRYEENTGRFISEFGLQAAPAMATFERWLAPQDLVLGSQGIRERIKDEADKATAMMLPITGAPATLQEFVDFTGLAQAEGLKLGIEHFRRRTPHCSGALIWQLNDCWPCVSWSLIDYDGVAKPSYYAVARAFSPVMASFRLEDDIAELWLVNDTAQRIRDQAIVKLASLIDGGGDSHSVGIDVAAFTSTCVWRGEVPASREHVLLAQGTSFPTNRRFLAPIRTLALSKRPGVRLVIAESGLDLEIVVEADHYALNVVITASDPEFHFSDNAFDVEPGGRRIVRVRHCRERQIIGSELHLSCFNGQI